MKKLAVTLALALTVSIPALAQAQRAAEAAQRAAQAAANTLPPNVALRFDVLREGASQIQRGKGDLESYLRFFSVTRTMAWNAQPNANVAQAMRELEQASVVMAQAAGRHLDLPPVAGAPQSAAPAAVAGAPQRIDANTMRNSLAQAESLAQQLWDIVKNQASTGNPNENRARQDLVGVAEALSNLRVAVEQNSNLADDRWAALEHNRARFMYSQSALPRLDDRLTQLNQNLEQLVDYFRQ